MFDLKVTGGFVNILFKWIKKFFTSNKPIYILFIDDEINDFTIVESLKDNGYKIDTLNDVTNIECSEIQRAKIIFVDFKGVGKTFDKKEQGLGLIKILKKKYGDDKKVILFSAHTFSLDKNIEIADDKIKKNASISEFISILEKYI